MSNCRYFRCKRFPYSCKWRFGRGHIIFFCRGLRRIWACRCIGFNPFLLHFCLSIFQNVIAKISSIYQKSHSKISYFSINKGQFEINQTLQSDQYSHFRSYSSFGRPILFSSSTNIRYVCYFFSLPTNFQGNF